MQGARRAVAAGFDAVELHGAHGYLLGQILSPFTNRRTDDWGGPLENRARFALEVVKGIRAEVGPDFVQPGFEQRQKGNNDMSVMRLGYVHIRVTDLQEARDHYSNTLACRSCTRSPAGCT